MKRRLARLWRKTRKAMLPGAPLSAAEHARNGDLQRNAGDWEGARGHYMRAVDAKPDLGPIWVQLGHAHKVTGDLEKAEVAYRSAVRVDGDVADSWLQLGHLLKTMARPAEALQAFEMAFNLSPDDIQAEREAKSLRAALAHEGATALPPPPRFHVTRKKVQYWPASATGARRVLVDLTAARDRSEDISRRLSKFIEAADRGSGPAPEIIFWDDTAGVWLGRDGQAVAADCFSDAIVLVSGPGTVERLAHTEALRHLSLNQDALLAGLFLDLHGIVRPDLYPAAHAVEAARFLSVCKALASGVIAAEGVAPSQLLEVLGGKPSQICSIPFFEKRRAAGAPDGDIFVVEGLDSEGADQLRLRAGLSEDSTKSRLTYVNADLAGELTGTACGVIFLSPDHESRVLASDLIAAGMPVAVTSDPGFSALAEHADSILDLDRPKELGERLASFPMRSTRQPPSLTEDEPVDLQWLLQVRSWRRCVIEPPSKPAPVLFGEERGGFKAVSTTAITLSGPWPESAFDTLEENKPLNLSVRTRSDDAGGDNLSLLISAPSASVVVSVSGSVRGNIEIHHSLAGGDLAWIQVPMASVVGASQIRINTRGEAKLHAAFAYPSGRQDLWWRFLDDVGRGYHPQLKQLAYATGQVRRL